MDQTRVRLILDYPFFGSQALMLRHAISGQIKSCRTDGRTLQWNPAFVDRLSPNEKLFLYLHEICHIILGHSVRRNNRRPKVWNFACDYAVNELLRNSVDLAMPQGVLLDDKYAGMGAEEIYRILDAELPEDLQQVVKAACEGMYNPVWTEYTTKHALSLKALVEEHGVAVKKFPDEVVDAMGVAAKEVIDDLLADEDELVVRIAESFVAYRDLVGGYKPYSDNGQMNARAKALGY